jgi:hypothetical protein
MNGSFPDTHSPEASEEGTAAHEVAHLTVTTGAPVLGQLLSNGLACTQEMLDGGVEWFNAVFAILNPLGVTMGQCRYEESLAIAQLHETCFGTPDAWYYHQPSSTLYVFDYKFGHGLVDEYENWQMLAYALGAMYHPAVIAQAGYGPQQIVCVIVQPRCYRAPSIVRSWELSIFDFWEYVGRMRQRIQETEQGIGDCRTSSKQCGTCNGRHACNALQQAAQYAMDYAEQALPIEMPAAAVGLELAQVKHAIGLLEARESGLLAQGMAYAASGQLLPGWSVKNSMGRERWTDVKAAQAMGCMLGVDLCKPIEAVTPSQARKLLAGKIDLTIVDAMIERPKGEAKLVPEDTSTAKRVFGR